MPDKIANIDNMSIGISTVAGWIISLLLVIVSIISSYAVFIVQTLKDKISDLEKKQIASDAIFDKVFEKLSDKGERLSSLETDLKNLRHDHDKNHRGKNK